MPRKIHHKDIHELWIKLLYWILVYVSTDKSIRKCEALANITRTLSQIRKSYVMSIKALKGAEARRRRMLELRKKMKH